MQYVVGAYRIMLSVDIGGRSALVCSTPHNVHVVYILTAQVCRQDGGATQAASLADSARRLPVLRIGQVSALARRVLGNMR